jgi:hypothetical protein
VIKVVRADCHGPDQASRKRRHDWIVPREGSKAGHSKPACWAGTSQFNRDLLRLTGENYRQRSNSVLRRHGKYFLW